MQRLYWRPATASSGVHVLVAVIALAALFAAERFQRVVVAPDFEEKQRASSTVQRAFDLVRSHRTHDLASLAPIDLELDPTGSGMIGFASSITTTNSGSL